MKGAVAEQNYWPGYLDALINVMLVDASIKLSQASR